jgi:hypothetical protein
MIVDETDAEVRWMDNRYAATFFLLVVFYFRGVLFG